MKVEYTRLAGARRTYEITADRHGSWEVRLEGKVVKRYTVAQDYYGKPRWGTKKLEAQAVEDAKMAIEALKPDER